MALVDYGSDNAAGSVIEQLNHRNMSSCLEVPLADSIGDSSEEDSASDSQDSYFEHSDSDR